MYSDDGLVFRIMLTFWFVFILMCLKSESVVDINHDFEEYDAENEDKNPSEAIIIDIQATEDKKDEINALKVTVVQETEFRAILKQQFSLTSTNVPYKFASSYKEADKKLVLDAIADFNNKTCVRFEPRKNETTYILIDAGSGCSAGIGLFNNTVNNMQLPEPCLLKGTILHELMHTLGFLHEQNRPDRDDFVTINWDNILEGVEVNFKKYNFSEVNTLGESYDYGSVMHYGMHDFAKNRSMPTIIPKKKDVEIGQRKDFSKSDILKINKLFNCTNKKSNKPQKKARRNSRAQRLLPTFGMFRGLLGL